MGMDDPLPLAWPDRDAVHHLVLVAVDLRHPAWSGRHVAAPARAGMGDVARMRSIYSQCR